MRLRLLGLLTVLLILVSALPVQAAPAQAAPAQGQPLAVSVTGAGGNPVAGARVEVIAPGSGIVTQAATGPSGQATLGVPGAASTYWVRVWGAGYRVMDQPWVPAADGSAVSVSLPPLAGSLAGLISDQNGLPVVGAHVSAWNKDAGLAAQTDTDSDGTYSVTGLAVPGPYQVQITASGFRAYGAVVNSLAAGEEQRLDAALTPGTAAVSGVAADARSGAPLSGARVELMRKGWGILASALTDDGGAFSLTAPPADSTDYQVRLWAGGHALVVTAPFALAAGSRKEFTGSDQLLAPSSAGSVWGVLTDDQSNILPGAAVDLQLQGVGTVASAATDADGLFTFNPVESGTYRVRAYPGNANGVDYVPSDSIWVTLTAGSAPYVGVAATRYTRHFYKPGIVAGTATDLAGQPLAGALVTLTRGTDNAVFTTTTDALGHYAITNVDGNRTTDARPAGTGYVIRVDAKGYWSSDQPATVVALPAPAAPVPTPAALTRPSALIDVYPGGLTQADFSLRPLRAALAGTIYDDQGAPLPGATVTLYREGAGAVAHATAGAGGSYRFDGLVLPLRSGYLVEAGLAGYATAAADAPRDLAPAPGAVAGADLRLRPVTARLAGRVTDPLGAGLAGAQVSLLNPVDGSRFSATADGRGWYAVAGLPAGPGDQLVLQATGSAMRAATTASGALSLTGSRGRTLNLQAAPAGTLAGTVYDPQGTPLPGATVALWHEGEAAPAATVQADPNGAYRFPGLLAGDRYTAEASAPGFVDSNLAPDEASMTPLLRVAADTVSHLDLQLASP